MVDVQKQHEHVPKYGQILVQHKVVIICMSMCASEPITVAKLQKKWKSIPYEGIDHTTHREGQQKLTVYMILDIREVE